MKKLKQLFFLGLNFSSTVLYPLYSEYRGSPTYTKITNTVSTNTVFGPKSQNACKAGNLCTANRPKTFVCVWTKKYTVQLLWKHWRPRILDAVGAHMWELLWNCLTWNGKEKNIRKRQSSFPWHYSKMQMLQQSYLLQWIVSSTF